MDDTTSAAAIERLKQLELVAQLRREGGTEGGKESTALMAIGWSRATDFRWRKRYQEQGLKGELVARSRRPHQCRTRQWTRAQASQVRDLRQRYPFMGKRRLRVMLQREGLVLNESTLGRILAIGVCLGRIRPCAFCRGRVRPRKHRQFSHRHAQGWQYGSRTKQPGERVQSDHLSVAIDGTQCKAFKAIAPVGKQRVTRVYSNATARSAKRFLQAVIAELPFPLLSVHSG